MKNSLYNLLGMKRKNSILKSVYYVEQDKTFNIETYDETFLKLEEKSFKERQKSESYINESILKFMKLKDIDFAYVANYSLFTHHKHYVISLDMGVIE